MNDAWRVVVKTGLLQDEYQLGKVKDEWWIGMPAEDTYFRESRFTMLAIAKTAALAICIAALRAKGVEVE